jgi:N-acetylglucosamine-6-sulfatase
VQPRQGVLAALCAVTAMVVAACSGAAAAGPGVATAEGDAQIPVVHGDDTAPRWEPSTEWAMHPETLLGSKRLRELSRRHAPDEQGRPNIVLISTDDMATDELRWMPKTRALLERPGVRFTDSLSPHPMCCPARAEILTGQFAQNNGVHTNTWPTGGYYRLDHTNTLPIWLKAAGYETAFLGKYLNEYGMRDPHEVPPGWDHWQAIPRAGVYDYYNYGLNQNGHVRDVRGVYQTDYWTEQSERLIHQMSSDDQPFFLWESHVAPHVACPIMNYGSGCWETPLPSTAYTRSFDHVRLPSRKKPSYDEADVSDKPHYISANGPIDREQARHYTDLFQRRIESLQSVDDGVARTLAALDEEGELDNTLILFISDNGYLIGEHRASGKNMGYEESLQVPLLMRGPGIPAGVRNDQTVSTVDLAPTIAAAAHARPGLDVDGRNLLPVAKGKKRGWETILIQAGPNSRHTGGWLFRGVRTSRYTYMRRSKSGDVELYDRRRDPYELHNLAGDPAYARTEAELRMRLQRLQDCAGAECRQRFGPVPAPRPAR